MLRGEFWFLACVVGLLLSNGLAKAGDDPWADYRFLIGEWVAEEKPGAGSGEFSLKPDLKDKVLVRKNRASVPAANGRPAANHEDLMVIYRGPDGKRSRAIYFDSEDHVINYTVTTSNDRSTLTFLSEESPSAPRFRLSYTKAENETVKVKFEIAPPGKPNDFKTYLGGTVRRKEPRAK
jgi:hypothetical protein